MPMPKERSIKDTGVKQGGEFQAKEMLKPYNSQTISKGSKRQTQEVWTRGPWKRRMLEPHEKAIVRLGQS
jgi:hypothetical protein